MMTLFLVGEYAEVRIRFAIIPNQLKDPRTGLGIAVPFTLRCGREKSRSALQERPIPGASLVGMHPVHLEALTGLQWRWVGQARANLPP